MSKQRQKDQAHSPHLSHTKGMIGEGLFIAWASRQGWEVYKGINGHTAVDYVAATPEGLKRVECRYVQAIQIQGGSSRRYVTCTKMKSGLFDALWLSTPRGNYFIPVEHCPATTISVRVDGIGRDRYEEFRVE